MIRAPVQLNSAPRAATSDHLAGDFTPRRIDGHGRSVPAMHSRPYIDVDSSAADEAYASALRAHIDGNHEALFLLVQVLC